MMKNEWCGMAQAESSMGSLGENLRREREMRGVSLEEISAATKISVRLLGAIENNDFRMLPGGIFARSFIRSYARYLGLDEEPFLAEFEQMAEKSGDLDLVRLAATRPEMLKQRPSHGMLWAVVGAALLLAAGYGVFRYSHQRLQAGSARPPTSGLPTPSAPPPTRTNAPNTPNNSPTPPPAAAAASRGAGQNGSEAVAAGPGPGNSSSGQATSASAAPASTSLSSPAEPQAAGAGGEAGLVLQVAATEQAWVSVHADGKAVLQGVLEPDEVKTLKAKKSFDVLTGNAQGIILTLNGATLKPLGRQGEVKSIRLTRASLKNP